MHACTHKNILTEDLGNHLNLQAQKTTYLSYEMHTKEY